MACLGATEGVSGVRTAVGTCGEVRGVRWAHVGGRANGDPSMVVSSMWERQPSDRRGGPPGGTAPGGTRPSARRRVHERNIYGVPAELM